MAKQTRESTKAYYDKYQGTPKAIHERAERVKARREMEKRGLVHKGDGKEVDHKHPLSTGGSNRPSNWRVESRYKNRAYPRDSRNRPI
jgi:hypothetical protein